MQPIKHSPETREASIVTDLRRESQGRNLWVVRHKQTDSWCIWFENWEYAEAREWWASHPDHHDSWELVRITKIDNHRKLMAEAAEMIAGLVADRDLLREQLEAVLKENADNCGD